MSKILINLSWEINSKCLMGSKDGQEPAHEGRGLCYAPALLVEALVLRVGTITCFQVFAGQEAHDNPPLFNTVISTLYTLNSMPDKICPLKAVCI